MKQIKIFSGIKIRKFTNPYLIQTGFYVEITIAIANQRRREEIYFKDDDTTDEEVIEKVNEFARKLFRGR
jgi:hypothetical protein